MINLVDLRKNGRRPRVHGNGFIQLDLTEETRLHIWGDPRIPRQQVATPIHDHVFNFKSTVLVGRLINVRYDVTRRLDVVMTHEVYQPEIREGEDTILMPTRDTVCPFVTGGDLVMAGTLHPTYYMHKQYFHETVATEPSASVIVKDSPTQAQGARTKPRVLVPIGKKPDNEFNRYAADEDLLWHIIEQTLERSK